MLKFGQIVSHHIILEKISGGIGRVCNARDVRLERTVVIKPPSPAVSANPEYRQQFERKASDVSTLNHPHIRIITIQVCRMKRIASFRLTVSGVFPGR